MVRSGPVAPALLGADEQALARKTEQIPQEIAA